MQPFSNGDRLVVPTRLDYGKEFLRVPIVNLRVQGVVDQVLLPDPVSLHEGPANDRGNARKGILDDAHAGHTYFQFIQHTGAGQDAIERSQSRRKRGGFDFFRLAADAPQETLKSSVMEKFLFKLAVFFDGYDIQVMALAVPALAWACACRTAMRGPPNMRPCGGVRWSLS